ncbi:GAF domain-containing protein [Nonomuraea zeae]|uniref:GAF domain-containing protein n=2 Tax=Nonomuraea zeae TaxID=1642303 RepID=A0A5S4FUP3_9ACTN|nr:GAF domain-containing protein [Nonomuraea zeae]
MDSEPEPSLDDLCELAASTSGAGQAVIALLDARHSFRVAVAGDLGAGSPAPARRRTPIHDDPAHLLVGTGRALIVEDATCDPRLAHLPVVRAAGIGAWAGFPIVSDDGLVLGALCVWDGRPRQWSAEQQRSLERLARSVSADVSLRLRLRQAQDRIDDLETSGDASRKLAQSLQDSLLPPVIARPSWLDAAALYLPASGGESVVGDFFDLFATREPWWCAVLGDVSGKGLEAAKVTALARYTVRTEATQHASPATVLSRLNEALLRQRLNDRFLTAACLMFRPDPDGRGVRGLISLGGHLPGLIRRADGTVTEAGRPGHLLGIFEDVRLHAELVELAPGDALLLYTDGVTEAHRRGGHALWGETALADLLAGCAGLDADGMLERITTALTRHAGNHRSDDTALLLLRVPLDDEA